MLLLLFCCITSRAQPVNLVPNGSFEDTIDFNNGFLAPKHWDMTLGSPDYFTALFDPPYDSRRTPQNFYGNQKPKEGKAYIGVGLKNFAQANQREYLQIKLNDTLMRDSLYDVLFWVNLPDSFHWACEQKNIAIAFSDTMIDYPQHLHKHINWLSPMYFSDSIWDPTNKLEWEKIKATIKAKGGEEYLIIGNFFNDNTTYSQDIGGGVKFNFTRYIYYFIDEIELYKFSEIDTLSSPIDNNEIENMIIPNVFTPNSDGINDEWIIGNDSTVKSVAIFNRWGDRIKEWNIPGNSWNGNDYPSGLYYYRVVYTEEGIQRVKTGSITLIR